MLIHRLLIFQLPVILVGIAAALHSIGYLKNHAEHRLSVYWGCFDLMLAAMLDHRFHGT